MLTLSLFPWPRLSGGSLTENSCSSRGLRVPPSGVRLSSMTMLKQPRGFERPSSTHSNQHPQLPRLFESMERSPRWKLTRWLAFLATLGCLAPSRSKWVGLAPRCVMTLPGSVLFAMPWVLLDEFGWMRTDRGLWMKPSTPFERWRCSIWTMSNSPSRSSQTWRSFAGGFRG